jgi:hypothetical protein
VAYLDEIGRGGAIRLDGIALLEEWIYGSGEETLTSRYMELIDVITRWACDM